MTTSSTDWSVRYYNTTLLYDWSIQHGPRFVRAAFVPAAPAVHRGPLVAPGADPAELHELRALANLDLAEISLRDEARDQQRAAAAARARQLLLGELDPEQRAQFEAEGHFIVRGRRGRSYRIRRGFTANIDMLQRGQVISRLCVHPHGAHAMPTEDVMLAQLLHLRDDERGVLQVANRHP